MKKLYLLAVEAAVKASDVKEQEKINAIKVEAFKSAGLTFKSDFVVYETMFTEQLNKLRLIGDAKLPSEKHDETI